tara:strand:+ start:244 stop:1146 length:903 start_codon:yes stop_codon:yes gene_type:complete
MKNRRIKPDIMKTKFLFAIICLFFLTGCHFNNKNKSTEIESKSSSHEKWSYSGESGPDYWPELEGQSVCNGQHQSPVNISDIDTKPGKLVQESLDLYYQDITTIKSITNNGHTIQYNFDAESNFVSLHNKQYKLKQFHFHSPSEHTINGKHYPLEIHFVHHSEASNSYIVIAMLVELGEPDPAFDFLEKYLPINVDETKEINSNYYFGSTFPEMYGKDTLNLYTYEGSLTTPPCTESVLWLVIKDPTYASASQIEMLQKLMPKNNYREVQPLNGRIIYNELVVDDISVLNHKITIETNNL